MPLVANKLYDNIMNKVIYPQSIQDGADKWCAAFDDYISGLILKSATVDAAKSAFKSTYNSINMFNGINKFPQCFIDYLNKYALGMPAANAGLVASATVTPTLNLSPVYPAGLAGASTEICIKQLSTIVHSWVSVQTFTNPTGATAIWF